MKMIRFAGILLAFGASITLGGNAFALGGGGHGGGGTGGGGHGGGVGGGGHMGGGVGGHGGGMNAGRSFAGNRVAGINNGGRGNSFRGGRDFGRSRYGYGIGVGHGAYGYGGGYGYSEYGYRGDDLAFDGGQEDERLQTGRSVAIAGAFCRTAVRSCQLSTPVAVGTPCSCVSRSNTVEGSVVP